MVRPRHADGLVTNARTLAPQTPTVPAHGRDRLAALLVAVLAAVLMAAFAAGTARAAPQVLVPACDGVNIRTAASTSATIRVRLGLANSVTVSGTVTGSSWGTSCPTWKSGSTW